MLFSWAAVILFIVAKIGENLFGGGCLTLFGVRKIWVIKTVCCFNGFFYLRGWGFYFSFISDVSIGGSRG